MAPLAPQEANEEALQGQRRKHQDTTHEGGEAEPPQYAEGRSSFPINP
jgi:hypothetical protein